MTKVETILAQVDGLLDAAYEVVNGRKLWKEVTPLVNIAADMLLEERKDYYAGCAYWVSCYGTEKEMLRWLQCKQCASGLPEQQLASCFESDEVHNAGMHLPQERKP